VHEITHTQKRSPLSDLHKILQGGRYPWRNHVCKFRWRSVKWSRVGERSNFINITSPSQCDTTRLWTDLDCCAVTIALTPHTAVISLVLQHPSYMYTVSQKNVPPLACYNFDAREWIWIFFGRNVTDKVGNQKTLYYATSNNLCFCTTWQNAETRKSHTSLNWIVLHT